MEIESTMQTGALGVARLLRYAIANGANAPVTSLREGQRFETNQRSTAERALRLSAALRQRGIAPGDVVATFCSTGVEHWEAYLGVPTQGAILHALNMRMADDDLAMMVHKLGDRALIVEREQATRFARLAPLLKDSSLSLVVVSGEGPVEPFDGLPVETISYESLLGEVAPPNAAALEDPEETAAAAICHTGGTTGRPKTVVYSHRSIWLQALNLCLTNSLGLSRSDVALLAVPLYHVHGWGLPYAAVMAGSGLVLPGAALRPEVLNGLIEDCGVTIAAGVPTIWTDLIAHRERLGAGRFRSLTRLATGGAVVPQQLIDKMMALGVGLIQAWGMTETSSMSVIGHVSEAERNLPSGQQRAVGYPLCGLEMRVVDERGVVVPNDGSTTGELQIRGACVTARYFGENSDAAFDSDWLKTGDIGYIDTLGRMTLTDRLKDAIKSGGEWIPAPVLEDALRTLPQVYDAVVIARPDVRWQERPFAVIVPEHGAVCDFEAMRAALTGLVPGWWIPDSWGSLEALPRTSLGKPDKAALKRMLAAGELNFSGHQTAPQVESSATTIGETK